MTENRNPGVSGRDLLHWLRHKWTKWEQYKQDYGAVIYPGEVIQRDVTRARIREKRTCEICGAMQDRIVTELFH